MSKLKLTQLANIEDYKAHSRVISPLPPAIKPDNYAIKLYSMLELKTERSKCYETNKTLFRNIVFSLFDKGLVNPYLGFGFAILSEDVININTWGGEYPSLLHPHLFGFDNSLLTSELIPLDISELGSYCAWEGEIVGHESRKWRRYLHSKRKEKDKQIYLLDTIGTKRIR